MLNLSKIRKRTHWFQITSCFLASATFWNVARAREWISLREWSGGTAQLHIFEETWSSLFEFWLCSPISMIFCFTWEFGNMSPKNNCPRNSSNCFRKKQITKFHCKIGNQLFNKFSIVPLVSFLLLFTSKNLTKKRLPWMSCLKFSTFSEKHEANKNKYGLTKELFSTRMTKTTHACSAV